MRATERYERAWNAFQIHLNHNPKASLIPFLKERHVNHRSMHRWMSEKGYSVRLAKQQIRLLQAEARKECSEAIAKDTGMMFLPMEMPSDPRLSRELSFCHNPNLPKWNNSHHQER